MTDEITKRKYYFFPPDQNVRVCDWLPLSSVFFFCFFFYLYFMFARCLAVFSLNTLDTKREKNLSKLPAEDIHSRYVLRAVATQNNSDPFLFIFFHSIDGSNRQFSNKHAVLRRNSDEVKKEIQGCNIGTVEKQTKCIVVNKQVEFDSIRCISSETKKSIHSCTFCTSNKWRCILLSARFETNSLLRMSTSQNETQIVKENKCRVLIDFIMTHLSMSNCFW